MSSQPFEIPVYEVPTAPDAIRADQRAYWRRVAALAARTGEHPVVVAGLSAIFWALARMGDDPEVVAELAPLLPARFRADLAGSVDRWLSALSLGDPALAEAAHDLMTRPGAPVA